MVNKAKFISSKLKSKKPGRTDYDYTVTITHGLQ